MFESILEEKLTNLIDGMGVDEQYDIMVEYCSSNCDYDSMPYTCDEGTINEFCCNMTPYEIIDKYGELDLNNWDYFVDGIYGVEEWCGIEYTSDVVDHIMRNNDDLGNSEIEELLELFEPILDDYVIEICENCDSFDFDELKDLVMKEIIYDLDISETDIYFYNEEFNEIDNIIKDYIDENNEE